MPAVASASQGNMHVVVVGGGYAGTKVAINMRKTCKVTLVDPKDSMVHCIGALRSCVEPLFASNIFIPYEKTFGDSFVRGKVTKINKERNCVSLEIGKEIAYTHLVLATGTVNPFPGKVIGEYPSISKKDGIELYKAVNKEILKATSVVCIGGGTVGVEMAGELKTDFPDKEVILVHSSDLLCSKMLSDEAQSNLKDGLRKLGVKLHLGERVSNISDLQLNKCVKDQIVKTKSGKLIKTDLVFPCTGTKQNTDIFKSALGESMTKDGYVKVDEYFKVEGTKNIYAIGDIANKDEEKMARCAGNHADLLSKNWVAEIEGLEKEPYQKDVLQMLVPIGRNGGVGEANGFVCGDEICKEKKSTDLFAERFWNIMEQPYSAISKS